MSCARVKCTGQGIWVPVMLLSRTKKDEKPIRASLPEILQCETHKDVSTVADFLSDEGWDKMMRHLRENGKGVMVKNLTKLDWEPAPGKEDLCLPF